MAKGMQAQIAVILARHRVFHRDSPDLLIYRSMMLIRMWSMLFMLVASSLLVTTTVHAREVPGGAVVECSGLAHAESDDGSSPTDMDKLFAHHHGTCHAPALGLPASTEWGLIVPTTRVVPDPRQDTARVSGSVDPALRPPAA